MNGFYDEQRHGSARWAGEQDCIRSGLLTREGVFIGGSPDRNKDMFLSGDSPLLLFGGSGSGKTASICMFSALYDGSLFALDPKGEIAACTADFHRKTKDVYFINPANILGLGGSKINPLDILRADNPSLTADCQMIAESLIPVKNSFADDFFEITARQRIGQLLKHLVKSFGTVTLLDLKKILDWMRGDWDTFRNFAKAQLLTSSDGDIKTMAGEILAEHDNAPRQWSGFIGTITASFGWLEDESLQLCVSGADFSLSVLSDKKAAVFLIVPPEYMSLWKPFLRLCITIPVLYKQRRPEADTVLYMLDELATLGKFEMAERLYSFARGGGNRVFGVFQSLGQIEKLYGHAEIFLSSAQALLFKGCNDPKTAQMIEKMLGSQTLDVVNPRYQAQIRHEQQKAVNGLLFGGVDPLQAGMELGHWKRELSHRDKIERPLATASEVLAMPDNRMIGFISGGECPPIFMQTTPYYKRRDMRRVFAPNPYHP